MFNPLLPPRADNNYRGHKLALWLFGVVVLIKGLQNIMSIFNGYSVATGPDAIPLATYSPAAANTVLSLFALLGLTFLMICLLGVIVLTRYRNLVPLMFAVLVLDFLCRRLILYLHPIARTGTPSGFYVNLGLFVLMVVGFVFSLHRRAEARSIAAGSQGS